MVSLPWDGTVSADDTLNARGYRYVKLDM
jgi:hypothetical protein